MTGDTIIKSYAKHSALTEPGEYAHLIDALPSDIGSIRAVIAELIVHTGWAPRYDLPATFVLDRTTLPVAQRLQAIQAAFSGPLGAHRLAASRTAGTCRDYALLLCSALRHRAVPARVRCGFATYFTSGPFEDHWICEYWLADRKQWVAADAQIDNVQHDHLRLDFDCADLPAGKFLNAGQAWLLARSSSADPASFGHGEASGLWFMRVNVIRDLLALTKQETSAWDTWRDADDTSRRLDEQALSLTDRIAERTATFCSDSSDAGKLRQFASLARIPTWFKERVK